MDGPLGPDSGGISVGLNSEDFEDEVCAVNLHDRDFDGWFFEVTDADPASCAMS